MEENKNIEALLDGEILTRIRELPKFQEGSQEKKNAISELEKLFALRNDTVRLRVETEEKREKMDEEIAVHVREAQSKEKQLEEQKKDRWFKVIIAGVELIVPIIFYGIWMRRGFKFEKDGTYTSTTFRNLFSKFRPTKK